METAAEVVVRTTPADDAGARTADLYDWQAAMAAADGLSMFAQSLDENGQVRPGAVGYIICEHHEDWVALRGPDAELVSAKHREPASGAWTTIRQLVDDGGLAHLFSRWISLDGKPRARLVTCAALAAGAPRELAAATVQLREEVNGSRLDGVLQMRIRATIHGFAKALLFHRRGLPERWRAPDGVVLADDIIGSSHLDEARNFLRALIIQDDRPNRALTGHAAPSMYAQPILDRLGRHDVPERAVWEAVLQLFRSRMRARGPAPAGALPTILATDITMDGYTAVLSDSQRTLAVRTVAVQDIAVAVRSALSSPLGYIPLSRPLRLTRLSVKMARGGCADTSIERAELLRLDYQRYRRERRYSAPGGSAELLALERTLLRVADQATGSSRTTFGPWGAHLWGAINDYVDRLPEVSRPIGLDGELALGGICDLAAKCRVWFSPSFDVDAEIARWRAEKRYRA